MNEQEIFNALREAERRILPAKLVDPAKDGEKRLRHRRLSFAAQTLTERGQFSYCDYSAR